MAQYVFDANKYPNGTLLSALDWRNVFASGLDFAVTEIGATGRKYWRWIQSATSINQQSTMAQNETDFELLFLSDFTLAEANVSTHGFRVKVGVPIGGAESTLYPTATASVNSSDTLAFSSYNPFSSFTTIAPTGWVASKAIGCRAQYINSGNTVKFRFWQADIGNLQIDETSIWNVEGAWTSPTAAPPTTPTSLDYSAFSCISVGTAGDPAPYPDPSIIITSPTNLSVSNITETSADIAWT